jgi:hypothetical protein
MGYSCTKDASDMLGLIRHTFTDGATSNGLVIAGRSYFYEIGREHEDGRITGTLFQHQGEDSATKIGSFRISYSGGIVSFPRLKHNQRVALHFKFAELRRTNPMLLSSYSHGSI